MEIFAKPADEYIWSNGETTQWITVFESGNYYVTLIDSNGCNAKSMEIEITAHPLHEVTIIDSGLTLSSSASHGNQWFFNGNPIPGATAVLYNATNDGVYYVEATDSNGCTAISNQLLISVISVFEKFNDELIFVFPNPSMENFVCS